MSGSYTYATLRAAILSYAGDTGDRLTAELDLTIIPNAETQVLRDLDLEIFDVTGNVTFNSGVPTVVKPTGWLATRSLMYVTGYESKLLLLRSYEYLMDFAPNSSVYDAPTYYCELNDTRWMVATTPNIGVTGTARYMKRPACLAAANTTTWLGTNVGDLLFEACMLEFMKWAKNMISNQNSSSPFASWQGDYKAKLMGARNEFKHLIRTESLGAR